MGGTHQLCSVSDSRWVEHISYVVLVIADGWNTSVI